MWAYINKGSLLAAHTHVGSVEIDVITQGTARVQLVTPDGQLVVNQDVKPGDVFVIPPVSWCSAFERAAAAAACS